MRRASLTGAWSGAFRYPGDVFPETVFNAQIEEVGGALVGSIQEPNLLERRNVSVLTADIEGVRAGSSVMFTKFYGSEADFDHAVRYEGAVDDALLRIDGVWIIPNEWSGTFFMTRDDTGEAVAAEESVEAGITQAG